MMRTQLKVCLLPLLFLFIGFTAYSQKSYTGIKGTNGNGGREPNVLFLVPQNGVGSQNVYRTDFTNNPSEGVKTRYTFLQSTNSSDATHKRYILLNAATGKRVSVQFDLETNKIIVDYDGSGSSGFTKHITWLLVK